MAAPAPASTTSTTAAPAPVAAPAAPVGFKVFVGNLSFKTRDGELHEAFKDQGKVLRAKVIRDMNHSRRSLGYGFVEFAALEDAKRAVEAMNKKDVDGRQINVELAKPRDESAPRPPRQPRQPQQGGGMEGAPQQQGEGQRGGRGRGRGARGGPTGGQGQGRGNATGSNNNGGQPQQPREPRAPRQPRPEPTTFSKTVLFVSNLPFDVDDAAFAKIFAERNFKVKKATVVIRQNGKSKGFGFIEFENEDTQKAAEAAVNNVEIAGRKLSVRIAHTEMEERPKTAAPASSDPSQKHEQKPAQPAQHAAPAQHATSAAPAGQQAKPHEPKQPKQAAPAQQPAAQPAQPQAGAKAAPKSKQ